MKKYEHFPFQKNIQQEYILHQFHLKQIFLIILLLQKQGFFCHLVQISHPNERCFTKSIIIAIKCFRPDIGKCGGRDSNPQNFDFESNTYASSITTAEGWILGIEPRLPEPQSGALPLGYTHHMEDTVGFEPTNQGVADPRLTTWLRVHYLSLTLNFISYFSWFFKYQL